MGMVSKTEQRSLIFFGHNGSTSSASRIRRYYARLWVAGNNHRSSADRFYHSRSMNPKVWARARCASRFSHGKEPSIMTAGVGFTSTVHSSTSFFTTRPSFRTMWLRSRAEASHSRLCHLFRDFGECGFGRKSLGFLYTHVSMMSRERSAHWSI
jgi:hypothetical protein